MHGLGNDFVVLDALTHPLSLTPEQIRFIADRHFGVGCDQVLQVVGRLLAGSTRGDDLVARYGGDEFVVLCAGGWVGTQAVARRIHAAVREHDWSQIAAGLHVTISVGVSAAVDADDLVQRADEALFQAKRAGRDRVALAG